MIIFICWYSENIGKRPEFLVYEKDQMMSCLERVKTMRQGLVDKSISQKSLVCIVCNRNRRNDPFPVICRELRLSYPLFIQRTRRFQGDFILRSRKIDHCRHKSIIQKTLTIRVLISNSVFETNRWKPLETVGEFLTRVAHCLIHSTDFEEPDIQ